MVVADFAGVAVAGHFVGVEVVHSAGAAGHFAEEDLTADSVEDSAVDDSEGTDAASAAATDSSSASVIRPGIGLVMDTTDIPTLMDILTLMGILTHPTDTTGMTTAASQHTHRALVIRSLLPLAAA